MSTFCDFVPNDASCVKEEPVGNTDPAGGEGAMGEDNMMMENEGEMMDDTMNPLLGNLTYLHVALFGVIEASLA